MMKSPLCRIDAVASRNAESANAMAAEFGIPKAYGSYDELLADPDIEAISRQPPQLMANAGLPTAMGLSWGTSSSSNRTSAIG